MGPRHVVEASEAWRNGERETSLKINRKIGAIRQRTAEETIPESCEAAIVPTSQAATGAVAEILHMMVSRHDTDSMLAESASPN